MVRYGGPQTRGYVRGKIFWFIGAHANPRPYESTAPNPDRPRRFAGPTLPPSPFDYYFRRGFPLEKYRRYNNTHGVGRTVLRSRRPEPRYEYTSKYSYNRSQAQRGLFFFAFGESAHPADRVTARFLLPKHAPALTSTAGAANPQTRSHKRPRGPDSTTEVSATRKSTGRFPLSPRF